MHAAHLPSVFLSSFLMRPLRIPSHLHSLSVERRRNGGRRASFLRANQGDTSSSFVFHRRKREREKVAQKTPPPPPTLYFLRLRSCAHTTGAPRGTALISLQRLRFKSRATRSSLSSPLFADPEDVHTQKTLFLERF